MQENQQVVFMSDGGENVRRVQEYLHPFSEHLIDWFHITMRLTVLQQSGFVQRPLRPTIMRIAKAGVPLPAVHPAIRVLRSASEQIGRDEIL